MYRLVKTLQNIGTGYTKNVLLNLVRVKCGRTRVEPLQELIIGMWCLCAWACARMVLAAWQCARVRVPLSIAPCNLYLFNLVINISISSLVINMWKFFMFSIRSLHSPPLSLLVLNEMFPCVFLQASAIFQE